MIDDDNKDKEKLDIFLKSTKKIVESHKKQFKVVSPEYNKAIQQATRSLKIMDISEKLKLSKPRFFYNDEKIRSLITNSPFNNSLKNIIPNTTMISQMGNYIAQSSISPALSSAIMQIAETQRQFMNCFSNVINESISPALKALAISLEEARNNPDSVLSWMNYYDRLSEFFWIMPYKITTEELHEILQNVGTEKEFDQYIIRYFNKAKVESLIVDIREMLSNNSQRKVYDQIVTAYRSKSYALASIGITTMIDNSLSYYLIDKGCTARIKLFEPIINELELKRDNSDFSFIVMMVNSNINLLYEQIEFNNKISINTNKKSRRNPISHGKSYSYKKIDTIMLLNTLYYLLVIQNRLKKYKSSLLYKRNKKEFYIATKEEKKNIKEKIRNKNESLKNN